VIGSGPCDPTLGNPFSSSYHPPSKRLTEANVAVILRSSDEGHSVSFFRGSSPLPAPERSTVLILSQSVQIHPFFRPAHTINPLCSLFSCSPGLCSPPGHSMLSDLSSPVLSLAADVVKDLEGEVAVYGLWSGERVLQMPPVLPLLLTAIRGD